MPSRFETERRARQAHLAWRILFHETDCLTDPAKRADMLAARRAYQDRKMDWHSTLRRHGSTH